MRVAADRPLPPAYRIQPARLRLSAGYFVPTVVNNALPFIFLPILTRYLMPREYGNVSLFVNYVAIATSLSVPALIAFISNCYFDRPRRYVAQVIGHSFFVVGVFSLGAACLVSLLHFTLPGLLGLPLGWLLLVPFASLTYSLFQVTLGVIRNQKRVLVFGCHQVSNTLLNFLFSLLFVVALLVGWKGRVLGIIIANAFSAGMAVCYLARSKLLSLAPGWRMTSDITRFTATLMLDSSYSVVVYQLGFLLMQYYYGKELLGIYSVGFNIASAVLILATTLNLSLAPLLFEQLASPAGPDRRGIVRMLYANALVVVVGAVLVSLFTGVVLRLLTTPAYYAAMQFTPWLAGGLAFAGLTLFVKPILVRFEQQGYIGLMAIINLALLLVFNYAFTRWFGHMGIAYAFGLSSLLLLAALLVRAHTVLPLPWLCALLPAHKQGT